MYNCIHMEVAQYNYSLLSTWAGSNFSLPINKEEESVITNVKSYIAWFWCLKFMYKLDSKRTMLC